jgi:hypothetical protein
LFRRDACGWVCDQVDYVALLLNHFSAHGMGASVARQHGGLRESSTSRQQ